LSRGLHGFLVFENPSVNGDLESRPSKTTKDRVVSVSTHRPEGRVDKDRTLSD
jgi:hypothetical protein